MKGALRVFEALAEAGIDARRVVYDESFADEVKRDLLATNGVLVWVDRSTRVRPRAQLDPLLREVAATGIGVSAHPDTILTERDGEVLPDVVKSRHRQSNEIVNARHAI